MAKAKGYFNQGFSLLINLIIAILAGWICGFITRLMRGNIVGAIVALIAFPIFWVVDLVTVIMNNDLTILA